MTNDPLFLLSTNLFVAVLARALKPNLFTAIVLATVLMGSAGYLGAEHGAEIANCFRLAKDRAVSLTMGVRNWPPQIDQRYPELQLIDQEGRLTSLKDFEGRVILVELVGMSCPACVSFSGGHERGSFERTAPQANLESLDKYLRKYGRIRLDDSRLVFVQILLFNPEMRAPSLAEIQKWANHFGFDRSQDRVVLAGSLPLASTMSRELIPGFHLIDKQFILRAASHGGDSEKLYTELAPKIRELIK